MTYETDTEICPDCEGVGIVCSHCWYGKGVCECDAPNYTTCDACNGDGEIPIDEEDEDEDNPNYCDDGDEEDDD